MTIIPEDIDSTQGKERVTDRIEATGARAEDLTHKIAAGIAGALDGFVEGLERYELGEEAQRATRQAGELSRSAALEGQAQARTPEMQQIGSAVGSAYSSANSALHDARDKTVHAGHEFKESVAAAAERAKQTAHKVKEGTKVRAEAVAETGRRARHAPGHMAREAGGAWKSWKSALTTSIALLALAGVFGVVTLVVVTIALVVGLNALVGDPAGTFIVAALYAVIAGIAWGVAKARRASAARDRAEHMKNIRQEADHVVRPVRDAFTRGRGV